MSTRTLRLKGGQSALLDAEDFERLQHHTYRKSGEEIIRTEGGATCSMKHDVLGRADLAIKHISGDVLDNRKANLLVVRDPQTSHVALFAALKAPSRNPALTGGASTNATSKCHSPVMGVTFRRDRANSKPWRVRLQIQGKPFYLGHYAEREQAEQVAREAYAKLGIAL